MPFAYYGAKHGLCKRGAYPPPRYGTIIEPFAGAAGYSCRFATPEHRVILLDADPEVIALWRRVQAMTPGGLQAIEDSLLAERTVDPLVAGSGGSTSIVATMDGLSRVITPRMRKDWHQVRRRIAATADRARRWQVSLGDYSTAPDVEATWFIDPPYQPSKFGAGAFYRKGADGLDYEALAEWCRSRRGQVIVCEQSPARWLPFRPLIRQSNGVATPGGVGTRRVELIWTNDAPPRG